MTGEDATDLRKVKNVINCSYTLSPTYFNNVKNFIQLNKNAAICKPCSPLFYFIHHSHIKLHSKKPAPLPIYIGSNYST